MAISLGITIVLAICVVCGTVLPNQNVALGGHGLRGSSIYGSNGLNGINGASGDSSSGNNGNNSNGTSGDDKNMTNQQLTSGNPANVPSGTSTPSLPKSGVFS